MDVAEKPILRGISGHDQDTLGTCRVSLYGIEVKFVVVPSKFPMKFPVILGSCFCKISGAIIDYERNLLSFNEHRLAFENVDENAKIFGKPNSDSLEAESSFLTVVDRTLEKLPQLSDEEFNKILCQLVSLELPPVDPPLETDNDSEETISDLGEILTVGDASGSYEETPGKIIKRDENKVPDWLANLDCIGDGENVDEQSHKNELIEYIAAIESELGTINESGIVEICSFEETGETQYVAYVSESERGECDERTRDPDATRRERVWEIVEKQHSDSNSLERLSKLIDKTSDIFYLPGEPLPATNLVEHRISLIDDIPVNIRQYPIPQALQEFVREQINVLLQAGVIEPSESEYNSPLWVVPKADSPDGRRQYRMVTDYRKLNEKTVTMTYPIPNITHITEQLGGGNCFLVADLASGFYQIPLRKEDRKYTAFSTMFGHFQYVRLPFEMKNAPATFQEQINKVVRQRRGMFAYIDDIIDD